MDSVPRGEGGGPPYCVGGLWGLSLVGGRAAKVLNKFFFYITNHGATDPRRLTNHSNPTSASHHT